MPAESSIQIGAPAQDSRRASKARVVLVAQQSLAHLLRVDAPLGGEHALHERLLAHFQREHSDGDVLLDGGVLRDVEHERGLSHRRARRDDHEIGGLEPGSELVEIGEAAGDSGDRLAAALQRLDALHRRPHQLLHAREALQPALLAHLEDPLLRVVEQLFGGGATLESLGDDRRRRLDESPKERLLLHDLGVILDVGRRGHGVDQLTDVFLAAGRIELAAAIELVRERDGIDDFAALRDRDHRAEDPAMPLVVEHRVVDVLTGTENGIRVHEHGRDHRLLGLRSAGRSAVAKRVTR